MLFNRFTHSFRLIMLVLLALIIAGCGSGDGETPVSDSPLTGALLDGPVSGVTYSSGTQTGTTNAAGEFEYFPNETIEFSISGIKLGQVTLLKPSASGVLAFVTPVELTGSTDASDPRVVRLLQLLQSLDSDGDHSNGISISVATQAAAASIVIDFSDPDFDTNNPSFDLQTTVDSISDPDDPTPTIVSALEALQNFSTTIEDNNLNISLTPTFQLVWSDEFNATTLNTDDWNLETGYGPGGNGWGNDEWQLYTENSENLAIVFGEETDPANGYLRISAQCPAPGVDNAGCQKRNDSITSAKINTKDKQEFQFGKIEARIKVPTGKGAWPAFWSLGAAYPETPWPAAGEIDFMEVFSVDNDTTKDGLFTIHWEEPDGSGTRQFTTSSKSFDGSTFHIFEAEWSNDRIIGKIDRVEFANYPLDPATQSELLNPFYLILNVAMGGNPVPGLEPDATTQWPQEMLVDYVRVYQTVAGLNNDILTINFEGGPSKFVCFEAGAGCGGATGFAGGDAAIQPNPEKEGINPSANAGRFLKFNPGNGEAFGGTLVRLTEGALDFAASNEIFTMKVYSTRAVPVLFELADSTPNDGGIGVTVQHTGSGWEELEFDFTGLTAGAARTDQIVLIFDIGVVGDAEGDPDNWTFYFDDIVLQKLPPVTGGGLGDTDGDFGDGSSDGTGFGVFSETNTTTAVSSANIVSVGNTVSVDAASTAVTPFEGSTVLALTYSDNTEGNDFGGGVIEFDNADVSAFNALKLTIDAASFTGLANLTVQLEPPPGGSTSGNLVALADYIPVAVLGNWKTYEIPLADFSAVNPSSINKLGFFNARDSSDVLLAGTLYLDDIHFTSTSGGGGTGGAALPFSDDFESGDLAGWTLANSGTITADDTQAGSGTYSARIVAGPTNNPSLSRDGLGIGSVGAGNTIDVSFDMCGSFGSTNEERVNVALFSEDGVGGSTRDDATFTSVPNVWTRFTRSLTAGANVTGGVSVAFEAICGGSAGCLADVFIDNVDITNGGGDPGGPASGASCDTGGTGGGATATSEDFEGTVAWGDFGGGVYTVIGNPDISGINTSANVTQASRVGDTTDFGASTLTLGSAIDYAAGKVFTMKVWASRQVEVNFKLEHGGATIERKVNHSGSSSWEDLVFDFSAEDPGATSAISIFFDVGVVPGAADPASDWTFYLDDIRQHDVTAIEGFEGAVAWGDFGGGVYTVIGNPDISGINTSANVTQASRVGDTTDFGASTLTLGSAIDYAAGKVFTMKVWASRQVEVNFKLEHGGATIERKVNHSGSSSWEDLVFDFSAEDPGATSAISIFFDVGVVPGAADPASDWTFYLDDIRQLGAGTGAGGGGTGGGATATSEDFEGTVAWGDFGGGVYTVIGNPDISGINTSANVTQASRVGDTTDFGASTLTLGSAIDYAAGKVFTMKVWASRQVEVNFKLEHGGATIERKVNHSGSSSWEDLVFDFSAEDPGATSAISIFFDVGVVPGAADPASDWTFYLDDIRQHDVTAIEGFEGAVAWGDFGGGVYTVIGNPDISGINTSANVTQASRVGDTTDFGASTLTLGSAIDYAAGKVFTMKVWASRQVEVNFKLEHGGATIERKVNHSGSSSWEDLVFDFSAEDPGATSAISIFFDVGVVPGAADPASDWTFYLDDIRQLGAGSATGGGTGVEIAENGSFEIGDFTGWIQAESVPGNQTINTGGAGDPSSEGTRHLEINNVTTDTNSLVKQERKGLGTVTPGIAWTVTFDARGSFTPGGLAFAEFFCETAGGNEACGTGGGILGGTSLVLDPDPTVWKSFSFSGTAGPNTESLTLQLGATSGGGTANMFYDNISIIAGP